jgi:hypothetical protein
MNPGVLATLEAPREGADANGVYYTPSAAKVETETFWPPAVSWRKNREER